MFSSPSTVHLLIVISLVNNPVSSLILGSVECHIGSADDLMLIPILFMNSADTNGNMDLDFLVFMNK
jgi:hypothetical protein